MHVILYAAHFLELLFLGHIIMHKPQPALERHRDGHRVLGDGIHIGRNNWQMQFQIFRQPRVQHRVAREDL